MLERFYRLRMTLGKPAAERNMQENLLVSGALTGFDHAVGIVFRIASTLILTRLLSPDIFGLFALIVTFQILAVMLTDFGVRGLIIVSDHAEDRAFLCTCWSVQFVRGFGLSVVIGLIALGVYLAQLSGMLGGESVYGSADLPLALALSGLQLALQGLESVNQFVYARAMRFGRITILNITFAALGPILTIAIALVWPTIWALVASGLLAGFVKMVLTHTIFSGIAMRFCWQREHVAELFDRGKWIMSHSILHVCCTTADMIVLGAFTSATWIGLYYLARQFIQIPYQLMQKIEGAFGLQFFRHVDDGRTDVLRDKYYRLRMPFDVVACIFAGGFMTASPAVIDLLYDDRYLEAGTIMQILAIGLPLNGLAVIRNAYSAQKRFRVMTVISVIQTVSIWLGLIVALPVFGSTLAALLVLALHRVPELTVLLFMARRERWIDLRREFRFFPTIAVGAAMGWGLDQMLRSVI
ncbi:MAG: oligosaccharide flippase family protein [Pseudomonadota bacterium]